MAPQPPSRTALSLADVLLAVAQQPNLAAHRRRDLASAVRRVAQLLGREPGLIEATPRLLARRLAEIAPAAHGLSRGRWNNLRSLLGKALALVGPMAPGRHANRLSPEWQALWPRIPSRGL